MSTGVGSSTMFSKRKDKRDRRITFFDQVPAVYLDESDDDSIAPSKTNLESASNGGRRKSDNQSHRNHSDSSEPSPASLKSSKTAASVQRPGGRRTTGDDTVAAIASTETPPPTTAKSSSDRAIVPSLPNRIGRGRVTKVRVLYDPSEDNFPRNRRTTGTSEPDQTGNASQPKSSQSPKRRPSRRSPSRTARHSASSLELSSSPSTRASPPKRPRTSLPAAEKTAAPLTPPAPPSPTCSPPPSPPPLTAAECELCGQPGDKRATSVCTQCKEHIVHTDCLQADAEQYSALEANTWQCDECKTCTACYETSIIGTIYKCIGCFCYYHAECNLLDGRTVKLPVVYRTNRIRCAECAEYRARQIRRKMEQQQQQQQLPTATPRGPELSSSRQQKVATATGTFNRIAAKSGFAGFTETEVLRSVSVVEVATNVQAVVTDEAVGKRDAIARGRDEAADTDDAAAPRAIASAVPQPVHVPSVSLPPRSANDADMIVDDDVVLVTKDDDQTAHQQLAPPPLIMSVRSLASSSSGNINKPVADCWSPFMTPEANVLLKDAVVPDASGWSVEEVYKYFRFYFSKQNAAVMRIEEIDGSALLLLQRQDVLGLNVLLGVALLMYTHVVRLQTRSNDVRQCFNTK